MIASYHGHLHAIKLLIATGGDLNLTDNVSHADDVDVDVASVIRYLSWVSILKGLMHLR